MIEFLGLDGKIHNTEEEDQQSKIQCIECKKFVYMLSLDFNWVEYVCKRCSAILQAKLKK